MDDLLALMGGTAYDANDASDSDEAGLFDSETPSNQTRTNARKTSSHAPSINRPAATQSNTRSVSTSTSRNSNNQANAAAGTIDPLTKIRIISRQTSKVDLIDLLAPFQFHTTAILANMSNANLTTLITHPSNSDDGNSVGGRTDMATMGIVFSNSGTRISKTGRAFSIITLGDLHTGPTVSILLFGEAYSNFTTKIQTGSVLAMVGGSIMPSKGNYGGETRISLSVNDIQQLIMVGKAMDYGTCAAVDKRKGNYSNNENGQQQQQQQVKCKKHVDLRIGRFCTFHAKQQNQPAKKHAGSSSSTVGRNKDMTFMQSLRADKAVRGGAVASMGNGRQVSSDVMTMVMPGRGTVVTHVSKATNQAGIRFPSSNATISRGGIGGSNVMEQAFAMNNASTGPSRPLVERSLQRAPMHMKISNTPAVKRTIQASAQAAMAVSKHGTNNPYLKRNTPTDILGQALGQSNTGTSNNPYLKKRNTPTSTDILGQALSQSTGNACTRKTYTPLTNLAGKVQVPKPNALFQKEALPNQYNSTSYSAQLLPITPSPKEKSAMLEKQRHLAERMKKKNVAVALSDKMRSSNPYSKSKSKPSTSMKSNLDELLGIAPLSDEKRASVLEAKSKYCQEANAEVYAKSRQAVSELEKQEAAYDKRKKKSQSKQGNSSATGTGSAIIVSEYKCVTCNKITQFKPASCVNANHKVKRKREIKKAEGVVQKRTTLNTKSADDGGLVLGAGLEWSGWRGDGN